mgnify:FL=1
MVMVLGGDVVEHHVVVAVGVELRELHSHVNATGLRGGSCVAQELWE